MDSEIDKSASAPSRVAEKIGIFLLCLFLPVNYWTTVRDGKLPGHVCHVFCEGALVVQFFLNSVMPVEKIPEYVKGNILPAENLNLLEITSFVAPPIASNPPRLSKGWSWTWWTQVRTQTGPKCLGPGPDTVDLDPNCRSRSSPQLDLVLVSRPGPDPDLTSVRSYT